MSATLDAERLKAYFRDAPPLHIGGRTSKVVSICYRSEPTDNVIRSSVNCIKQIHGDQPEGNILVFLPGEGELEQVANQARNNTKDLTMSVLHASLSPGEQAVVFGASQHRKCIVTANIAETSLTITGIVYVVDPGLSKQMVYNARTDLHMLTT